MTVSQEKPCKHLPFYQNMKTAYKNLVITMVVCAFGLASLEFFMEAERVRYEKAIETKVLTEIGATTAEKAVMGDTFAKMTSTEEAWSEVRFASVVYGIFLTAMIIYNFRFIKLAVEQSKKRDGTTASAVTGPSA